MLIQSCFDCENDQELIYPETNRGDRWMEF